MTDTGILASRDAIIQVLTCACAYACTGGGVARGRGHDRRYRALSDS